MLSKVVHITFFSLFLALPANSQNNNLVWQRTIGGTGDDYVDAMVEDSDGNIYVLSTSENNQNFDLLVTKTNPFGSTIWSKQYGGSGDEIGASILINPESNITILASTNSSDAFMPTLYGYEDILLLELNPEGFVINKQNYGGEFIDNPASVTYTEDGHTILCGYSRSTSGDVNINYGQYDIWVAELASNYDIVWQQTYGGNDEDIAVQLLATHDGYVILGQSSSYEGVWNDNRGDIDVVLIKTDFNGNTQWQKSYGGFNADYAADIVQLSSGNLLIAGTSFSEGFDVLNNNGGSDAWLFEVNDFGSIIWNSNYGSYGNESVSALMKSDDRIFLVGTTNSSTIDGFENNGEQDLWLYEIDETSKSILNQNIYGASGFDSGKAIIMQEDGGVLLAGTTNSNDGIVQGNKGKNDGWLLKVGGDSSVGDFEFVMYPNPTEGHLYLNQIPQNTLITVSDQNGKVQLQINNIESFAMVIDLHEIPTGVYLVTIQGEHYLQTQRLVKL